MITVKELNNDDIKHYHEAFQTCYDLFQDVSGIFYKVEIDGQEKILYHFENSFTLLTLEGDGVAYEVFSVDENNQLNAAGLDDYDLYWDNGHMVFKDLKTGNLGFLDCQKRQNGEDFDGYNGIISYVQYSAKSNLWSCILYQKNVQGKVERIYPYHIESPFLIRIEKPGKRWYPFKAKSYIRTTFDYHEAPFLYKVATMKEYGTGALVGHEALSLQGSAKIARFYWILFSLPNYQAISLFPLGMQYKLEDLLKHLEELGFNSQVPQVLIDYHNGDLEDIKRYQAIANYIQVLENSEELSNGVILKYVVKDGGNDGENS